MQYSHFCRGSQLCLNSLSVIVVRMVSYFTFITLCKEGGPGSLVPFLFSCSKDSQDSLVHFLFLYSKGSHRPSVRVLFSCCKGSHVASVHLPFSCSKRGHTLRFTDCFIVLRVDMVSQLTSCASLIIIALFGGQTFWSSWSSWVTPDASSEITPSGFREPYGCQGLNPGLQCIRQATHPCTISSCTPSS